MNFTTRFYHFYAIARVTPPVHVCNRLIKCDKIEARWKIKGQLWNLFLAKLVNCKPQNTSLAAVTKL